MKSFKFKLTASLFLSNFLIRLGFFLAAGILLIVFGIGHPVLIPYGLALIIFDLIVSVIETVKMIRTIDVSEHPAIQDLKRAMDGKSSGSFVSNIHSTAGRVCEYYLKQRIGKDSDVSECIKVFEDMCRSEDSIKEDMLLFESGVYRDKDTYTFSLTRQYPNGEGEYFQIYMNLKFDIRDDLRLLRESVWNEDMNIDFFEYVRKSESYKLIKNLKIRDIEIGLDET